MTDITISTAQGGTDLTVDVAKGTDITLDVSIGNEITLTVDKGIIGPQGPQGEQGPAGQGVASGGLTGQVLYKTSNTDYATGWETLTTTQVIEGTNLYYTDARARASNSAGTGISYNSTTGVITNSAPDQTVVLTAGTGISTSGTYPNFTITNTSPSTGGTVTAVTGTAPVVSSGGTTPAISMPKATSSVDGYLSATDFTAFNAKGSGTVTSVAATVPSFLSVSGSPVTTSGTLALTYSGTALPVANGGTGASTLTGYVKGAGTTALTASTTIPNTDISGLGTIATQNANAIAITGGTIDNTVIGGTTPAAGTFTDLTANNKIFVGTSGANIQTFGTTDLYLNPSMEGTQKVYISNAQIAEGQINNTVIGNGIPATGAFTDLSITGTTKFDGLEGTSGQVLTSAGTGNTPIWTTPTTGTVTSVAATVPSFLSVTGSPITTSGTLALTYSGTALPVANGGTGVTASSGANSVVLRDASQNITANSINEGFSNVVAAGTTTVLTVSSAPNYVVTGSGGQTYQLPDATTLQNGVNYTFNNNQSSGTIVVKNNSSTTVATIQSGGFVEVILLSNSIAAGSWDVHNFAPSNVSWSTNTFDYAGSITSATWNGNAVQVNRGGTGAATLTGLVVGNGTSAMTTVTAPSGTVVGTSDTQTLTNKTLTSPVVNTPTITGGTIDNTPIGATTPSTGTFTTITGQTEVLKGTGQNYLTQSQSFSTWTPGSTGGVTANATTDPLGGSTGAYFYATNPTAVYPTLSSPLITVAGNTNYTISIYSQAGTQNSLNIQVYGFASSTYTYITQPVTQTLTGGWVRYSATFSTSTYTQIQIRLLFSSTTVTWTGTQGYYIWGAQLEIGSTLNTYIPTTTTAVYGTPTLSFSGVAGLGLQSDGSLYVSPAGTGAIQAQATTSTTAGGNARGANAVDWSTSRYQANQVASSAYSVISGGYANVGGGTYSFIGGGNQQITGGQNAVAVGGVLNNANGISSVIVGGSTNTVAGYYNFVGSGFTNSGTSGSAVTTQSGTMNATTAVTLSGSNASIKVGQYITGTSIAGDTYVAAISGTALTLSKVASGSSTSTLSFFTPHGVVVGGGNNQATGSYSFIGGGGDAGTAANRNVASGDWSTVAGGSTNSIVSGANYSVIAGGQSNQVTGGSWNSIAGGFGHNLASDYGFIGGGSTNLVSGRFGAIVGGNFGTTRGISSNFVTPACRTPISASAGVSQAALLILGRQTTDATATVITSDANAASGTNQVILPNNSAYYFTGEVISGVTGGGDSKGWTISGVIKRGANAGATTLVGSTVTSLYADAGAATWTIALTADTTNGGLKVTFTGQASTTIRTVCQIRTTEMTY